MTAKNSILWDACVLYRYLSKTPSDYLDHIDSHIEDVRNGKTDLYLSTLSLAELRPSVVHLPNETPSSIINKVCSFIKLVDTSPDIMSLAGKLRDNTFICSTDGPKVKPRKRILATGDAVQLATAVAMQDIYGVQNLEFHTFDDGKRSDSIDGKAVPMLSFHNWCKGLESVETVQLAVDIRRKKPFHPTCALP